ncbi:MAG: hypothetical protein J5507_00550 [Clostridia bacterium]|nr:hypothetical protein [Clostridia bacterium]
MQVTKYETNFKRRLFLNKTSNIKFKPDIKNEENKLINIYSDIEFQNFIGFGRSSYSVLLVIIYLHVVKKLKKKF